MSESSQDDDRKPSHSFLSCTEVAQRLGLSRQRFWQLRKDGVFPEPNHDEETGRPYYTEEELELCMDLRRRNVGLNGKVVLFYSPRPSSGTTTPRKRKPKRAKRDDRHESVIAALKALGLTGVTSEQVESAMAELFPNGREQIDQGDVVRAMFLHIQRKNSSDNVG